MLWLIVAVIAYFILAAVFLVDKYLLSKSIPDPKVYAFYIGVLGLAALLLIPFIDFYVLPPLHLFWSFISGAAFVLGIFWFFKALKVFEPSRIVPALGGLVPVFTFFLIYAFSKGQEGLSSLGLVSLCLLILGSVLITYEKSKKISGKSLMISTVAAFFFAVSVVFAKYVYLEHDFLLGLVWTKIGGGLLALMFLFGRGFIKSLFNQYKTVQKNTAIVFFSGQAAGASAGILQHWAIDLVSLSHVAFINALQGVQYVFLLVLAVVLSLKFPKLLKEEVSRETLLQKIVAVALIGGGLLILAFK
ncbi:MAG: hypothetical protein ABH805_02420 [Candidatus Nealsonbacteria bacterium]